MNTSIIKAWILAFRLRTLPLALASILMACFLAAANGQFRLSIFILSVLTTVCLQILSNLANDYGDSLHGADHSERLGPSRAVQAGLISAAAMKKGIYAMAALALCAGLLLLWVAFGDHWQWLLIFLGLGGLAIGAAITYTAGSKPYGYIGLGDLSVFLFFGWVGVMGSYFLYAQSFQWSLLLPATACGALAVGVLNINNIRDIQSDRQAGKLSVPVRIGREKAVIYHWLLLAAAPLCATAYTLLHYQSPYQWLFLLTLPLLLTNGRAVQKYQEPQRLDPYLKHLALATLQFVITFGAGLLIY